MRRLFSAWHRSPSNAPPPVLILSFNRPHYLRQVLEGLADGLEAERAHLFQDGAVNAYSGRVAAQQEDVDACVALFRRQFPGGRVHPSSANIGIAENFLRAERFAFEELGAECAYFFEDDLVPAPAYLAVMDRLFRAVRNEDRIAYFAAYGDHHASLARQRAAPRALATLGHHWAFGLKRSHWRAMEPLLAPYHASQDNVKAFVTTCLGRARINTVACFGRYIGETGAHFTPERYAAMGFGGTRLFDGRAPRSFPTPTSAEIERSVAAMAAIFAEANRALG
jgi:hypothetical protein